MFSSIRGNFNSRILIFSAILAVILISIFASSYSFLWWLIPVLCLMFYFSFIYPQIFFTLFVSGGVFKADPRLSTLNSAMDLTLFFGILTIIGTIYQLLTGKLRLFFPPRQILIPYVLLLMWMVFSLAYTPAPVYGFNKCLRFIFITSPAFLLPVVLFRDLKSFSRFFLVFIVLSLLMTSSILFEGVNSRELEFHSPLGSNYLTFGRVNGVSIIALFIIFFASAKSKFRKLISAALSLFFFFGILISGGRTPVIGFAVSILSAGVYFIKDTVASITKAKVKVLFFIIIFIILLIFVAFYFQEYFTTFFWRMTSLVEDTSQSALIRKDMFNKAVYIISDSGKRLMGLGIGGFSDFYLGFDEKQGWYPHNIFLEIGSELGIFALLIFLFLTLQIIRIALKNIKMANIANAPNVSLLCVALFACFVFMLVNTMASGDLNQNRLLFTFMGAICASGSLIDKKN